MSIKEKRPRKKSTRLGAIAEELKPGPAWEPPDYWQDYILEILTAWYEQFHEIPTDRMAGMIIMARNRWESQDTWVTSGIWIDLIRKSPDLAKIADPHRRMGRLIQMVSLHI